jgi:hypothetical protein
MNIGCVFAKFVLRGEPDFSLTLSGVPGTKSLRIPGLSHKIVHVRFKIQYSRQESSNKFPYPEFTLNKELMFYSFTSLGRFSEDKVTNKLRKHCASSLHTYF